MRDEGGRMKRKQLLFIHPSSFILYVERSKHGNL
jgi:hypothetical protein